MTHGGALEEAAADGDEAFGVQSWSCAKIAGILVACLTGLVILAIVALEESLKDPGGLDSGASTLEPGESARYGDGLRVTVSSPSRRPDGSHRFTITYDNDSDETVRPIGNSVDNASEYEISHDPLIVRSGHRFEDDAATEDDINWANREQAARRLLPPLEAGDSVMVPIKVTDAARGTTVTVTVQPPSDGYREDASWEFTLD